MFISSSFIGVCESLGISVQPAPPGNGPAKGHVERTFSSINTLFVQHVASYTGSHTGERGRGVEGEAVWTLRQVADMLDEWIVCGWQVREHDGLRHPMMPARAVSPNEMWAALVAVCGYVPVPLKPDDYIELMPVRRQKINDYGIRIDYRTYDHEVLNAYRGKRSSAADGLWEIHYDPHAPGQVWVRLPQRDRPREYVWESIPWIHRTLVDAPFTDFTWQHLRRTVSRRGDRVQHEHDLALALRELLERAAAGQGSTRREKVVTARARASADAGAVWKVLYGERSGEEGHEPDEEDVFGEVEEDFEDGEEVLGAGDVRDAAGGPAEGGQQRPDRGLVGVYDPFEGVGRW